jgi:hypothetical protein
MVDQYLLLILAGLLVFGWKFIQGHKATVTTSEPHVFTDKSFYINNHFNLKWRKSKVHIIDSHNFWIWV